MNAVLSEGYFDWLFQSELQESKSRLRNLEAELQKAKNQAYNAEHQLIQLSLKVRIVEASCDDDRMLIVLEQVTEAFLLLLARVSCYASTATMCVCV